MKLDVIKLDGGKAGTIDLDEALFGLDPRADGLQAILFDEIRNRRRARERLRVGIGAPRQQGQGQHR